MSRFFTISLYKALAGAPRLEREMLSAPAARAGDTIRISAHAMDAQGLYVSPYGEPEFLEYVRKSPAPPGCIENYPDRIVYADYRVKAGAPVAKAKMQLAIRYNSAPGVCDGRGNTADIVTLYLNVEAPPTPPPPLTRWCEKEGRNIPADEWTEERCVVTPPPPAKPTYCDRPILRWFFRECWIKGGKVKRLRTGPKPKKVISLRRI